MAAPPHARQPLLAVDDLVVSFRGPLGAYRALNGGSFHVDAGETLAILGESGSGKSVTMRAVMALLPRHSAQIERGTIRYDGEDLSAQPARRTRELSSTELAMVFQDSLTALGPAARVYDEPAHPYTRALISAAPVPRPWTAPPRERIVLTGEVPSPAAPPSGCRFLTRCPLAQPRCAQRTPELRVVAGREVACHYAEESQAGRAPAATGAAR
ncbi:Oligopeptide transport ATP-binding protein OppD [Micromonospora sp. MW-13]|uniref:oligopeptide/dipeptide ABC transporter ATP-binding protein n=1 Tax=Micromonospora sp. MW-13 TaxID=2094022 RepID=UPI000E42F751|nr:oligopeptide/dipeptide ABC transporter ATP-binding protein [Micromonospora sp. MW-13]RGC69368.1 Oligopeptide transport ATP-binding protein OppD [Micromonospora sp. MW-13]